MIESEDNDIDNDAEIMRIKKRRLNTDTNTVTDNYEFHDEDEFENEAKEVSDESDMDDGMSQYNGERPMCVTGGKHRDNHRIIRNHHNENEDEDEDEDNDINIKCENNWAEKKRLFDVC